MSMRPKCARVCSTAAVAPAKLSRSAVTAIASAPAALASHRTSSTSEERSTSARWPPSRAIRNATVRPMPCAAPVTIAILSVKRVEWVIIASRRLMVGFANHGYSAARRELLVVEIGRRDALLAEPSTHGLDHPRRTAEIHVDIAAIQLRGLDVPCHVAFARIGARLGGDAASEGEAGDGSGELIEALDRDEILLVGHTVD